MPVPPPSVPTPSTPAPAAKAPAPEQPATFSGTVRLLAYSDLISTGEGKAAKGIEFEKVESALKRISGVTSASFDSTTRSIQVGYSGTWSDLNKLETAVNMNGVSAEIVNPAKVILRPMVVMDDESKVIAAVKGVVGVQYVTRENNDVVTYCDLASTTLGMIRSACESAGVKGAIVSHEEHKIGFGTDGNAAALQDDLSKTKWVVKVDVDSAGRSVNVLALKGRVTKSLIKSIMAKHGFAEAK
jgi:hypothetical protein